MSVYGVTSEQIVTSPQSEQGETDASQITVVFTHPRPNKALE
jgi:hypothetical protein